MEELQASLNFDASAWKAFARTVVDSSNDCIKVLDRHERVLAMNAAGQRAMEVDNFDHVCQRVWHSMWPTEGQLAARVAYRQALDGKVSRFEGYCPTLKGTPRWWEVIVSPIVGDREQIDHILVVSRDITSQRRTEREAVETELRFQSLADHMAQFAWMAEPSGDIVWYNKRWFEYTGTTLKEMRGWGWRKVHHPDHVERVTEKIRRAFESGDNWEDTFPLRSKTGEYRWFLSRMMPIRDEHGRIVRWLGTNTDITENLRVEQELRKTMEQAEMANRAKSQFLANMSHEIRSPMTAILGYAELLTPKDEAEFERIETIRLNGQFLIRLLNDILDLSKIEAGKVELETVAFNPGKLVEEVCSLMAVRAAEGGLSLQAEFPTPLPATMLSDPIRVRQILINLVGNAIKFTEEGRVRLVTRYDADQHRLMFDVIDTGCGIPVSDRERLFLAFEQADPSVSRQVGGSGLGLAISQRLAHMMGGSIELESEVGKGSTFSLVLENVQSSADQTVPYSRSHAELNPWQRTTSPSTAGPESSGQLYLRVLVVDDRRDIRFLTSHFLTTTGCEVSTAENGQEAVDKVIEAETRSTSFDAILMDVQMPVLDGLTAVKLLRDRGISAPIIALTANAMEADREACLAAGYTDFLTKPIDSHNLIATLRTYCP